MGSQLLSLLKKNEKHYFKIFSKYIDCMTYAKVIFSNTCGIVNYCENERRLSIATKYNIVHNHKNSINYKEKCQT